MDASALKATIHGHPEFAAFMQGLHEHFVTWRGTAAKSLKSLKAGLHPKSLIVELSEGLLAHYRGRPLIDPYAVYQHLMDYWDATMQDDAYQIAADGWKALPARVLEEKKNKEGKVTRVVDKGWVCDLVPKALIVARYFAQQQAAIDTLAVQLESTLAQGAELEEEHSGEDDVFGGYDKINAAAVKDRIREIQASEPDADAKTELAVLRHWLALQAEGAALKKQHKDAEALLDQQAHDHYASLTEAEVKTLVVDDKWMAALGAALHGEADRISQQLTQRVKQLAERYATPLPELSARVAALQARADGHLQAMGFTTS